MRQLKLFFLSLAFLIGGVSYAGTSASDVTDRASLKRFVDEAADFLAEDYFRALQEFRYNDRWNKGSIYLYVYEMNGICIINAAFPGLDGTNQWDLTDPNGVKIMQELIAASERGGDFVDYHWPHPEMPGDGPAPKLGYAQSFKMPDGTMRMVGSGYYVE